MNKTATQIQEESRHVRFEDFDWACLNDITVHNGIRRGLTKEEIIGRLARDKERLTKRIMELEHYDCLRQIQS